MRGSEGGVSRLEKSRMKNIQLGIIEMNFRCYDYVVRRWMLFSFPTTTWFFQVSVVIPRGTFNISMKLIR